MQQREDYIDAVLCLQSLPPRLDSVTVPGARSRFDDFVAEHINVTLSVHITVSPSRSLMSPRHVLNTDHPDQANFLTWHRYFTWLYEQALREECGYKGYQPVGAASHSTSFVPCSHIQSPHLTVLELGPLRPRPDQLAYLQREHVEHVRQRRVFQVRRSLHQQRHAAVQLYPA